MSTVSLFSHAQILDYMAVSTLSLLAYDFLIGIFEDIHILSLLSIRLPDVIYILSRLLTTAEVIVITYGNSLIPLALCNQRPRLMVVKAIVAVLIPCNSWLLLLRVRAVPPQFLPHFAVITCTILWATTLTSFLIFPGFGVSDVRNQDGVCSIMTYYDTRLLSAPFVTLLVFDTASTIIVSLSLASYVPAQMSWSERIRSMMHIEHMGQLSKVFLRSGQIYYLATFGIHLGVSIVALSSAIPSDYSAQLGLISCTYHNIMTCRVYRLLKLGLREGANGSTFDVASHDHSLIIFHRDDNATPIVVDTHLVCSDVKQETSTHTKASRGH